MKTRAFLMALCVSTLLSMPAFAQTAYPTKPIRMIVPWGAGGATDVMGRVLADVLQSELEQTVVVENVPGASSIIGTSRLVRSPADGYTLMFSTNVHVINPSIRKLPYDALKDVTPLALIGYAPNLLIVKSDSPYRNYQDYAAASRADPGGMTYATPGMGTSTQFAAEQFGHMTGTRSTNIAYNSTTAMVQSVLAGHVKSTWLPGQIAEPYVRAGQLKALGVAAEQRSIFLPDIPTFDELGLKGFVSESWWGFFAPANLPAPIVTRLTETLSIVLARPDVQEKMRQAGLDRAKTLIGEPFRTFMVNDLQFYRNIVQSANIPQVD